MITTTTSLNAIRTIAEAEGPFATVYLEGRSPAEDAAQQVRLRWEELRRRLTEAGAEDAHLQPLEDAILVEDIGEVMADGRVLVTGSSGLLLDAPWDAALGAGDAAHFADEAQLGPYLRERFRSVRMLVAVADQQGALVRQVVVAAQHTLAEQGEQEIGATSDESVHKPRQGALSHNQIQRRADEAVKQNARGVAEHLETVAGDWDPDLLVLAGEVQGRTALREELPVALAEITTEIEAGGIGDDGAEQALADALRELATETGAQRSQELTERFDHGRAHRLAVEGIGAVRGAIERGAVETLLLESERQAADEAALIAASARIDAQVGVVDAEVHDAIAAVLRFEIAEDAG
ncbi:hypothetical protein [Brachybacterium sacelli]|uniref:Peptide chain release factor 1 n=1 Tax=Brachybacterium sacelli TaxID=173364 RepID=A0ABS4WW86_9MICO|nr:hypothetical protein [Brachybacterium sacelli]MBP2380228.1 hypothetical protein [Brachybacterium sacelli]